MNMKLKEAIVYIYTSCRSQIAKALGKHVMVHATIIVGLYMY